MDASRKLTRSLSGVFLWWWQLLQELGTLSIPPAFKLSSGDMSLNVWRRAAPDSALIMILGMWQPTQLEKEWIEWENLFVLPV
jgi:hypothetical protein